MSQGVRLQCAFCARFVYVAGRAEDPYVCPICRGAAVVEPSDDLAAVTAERDRLAADLAALREAAWALLAVDGGDGHYHAIRLYDARVALRSLVGEPPPAPDPAED